MPFDPVPYLINLSGKKYLEVRFRVEWFRDVHPRGTIETTNIALTATSAAFRAVVGIPADDHGPAVVLATGHGSETENDFHDYVEKAECCHADTHILTTTGFRHHTTLRLGELVAAYNLATDRLAWTPLRRIATYADAPVVRLHGECFEAVVTPNHSWATNSTSRSWITGEPPRRLKDTADLKTSDRLILSAPAEGGTSDLTPTEAATLGWLVTDGSIWEADGTVDAHIYQSKPAHLDTIRALVGSVARESVGRATMRAFPNSTVERTCLPGHVWHMPAAYVRALTRRAGVTGYADLPALATRLTEPARAAMLSAMMAADGDTRGYFGKRRKPGVQECWQVLATLQGDAVGPVRNAHVFPVQRLKARRFVSCSILRTDDAGRADVWCPTTDLGTWVARLPNGQVTITGNTKAIGRALAAAGFGTQFTDDLVFDPEGRRVVDTPVALRPTPPPASGAREPRPPVNPNEGASERQLKAIIGMASRVGLTDVERAAWLGDTAHLSKGDASRLIEYLGGIAQGAGGPLDPLSTILIRRERHAGGN